MFFILWIQVFLQKETAQSARFITGLKQYDLSPRGHVATFFL